MTSKKIIKMPVQKSPSPSEADFSEWLNTQPDRGALRANGVAQRSFEAAWDLGYYAGQKDIEADLP